MDANSGSCSKKVAHCFTHYRLEGDFQILISALMTILIKTDGLGIQMSEG